MATPTLDTCTSKTTMADYTAAASDGEVAATERQAIGTSSPQLVTTLQNKLDVLGKEIEAVKHVLKGDNSTSASEDIREFIRIYDGGKTEWLRGMLSELQREKSALVFRQAAVERLSIATKGAPLYILQDFNFNVASWDVGCVVDCSALSEAMRSYGGFPSTIFVREEMMTVWSILVDGIVTQQSKWVLIGSPGVGKSILTVLLCFHLARNLGMPVFLARQLKGESGALKGEVAICIEPAGTVVAYPSRPSDRVDLADILEGFGRQIVTNQRLLLVLDGWTQAEFVGGMQGEFGGFDLLATSAQYNPTSQDVHRPLLLPAWNDIDLLLLWDQCRPDVAGVRTFKEQLYYSGGSARELLRPIDDIRCHDCAPRQGHL
jgi:hypothetical protein